MFVDTERAYLGASPDALVTCACCGDGLLEIKCPRSIVMEEPNSNNWEALISKPQDVNTDLIHGTSRLKQDHQYYYQIQCQMGITGRPWCDFFVYTQGGFHLERIPYQEDMWQDAKNIAEQFFIEYLAPELVSRKIHLSMQVTPNVSHGQGTKKCSSSVDLTSNPSVQPDAGNSTSVPVDNPKPNMPPQKRQKSRKKKQKKLRGGQPVYMCGTCAKACKDADKIKTDAEFSVGCDGCSIWFHWSCQNIMTAPTGDWFCTECQNHYDHLKRLGQL